MRPEDLLSPCHVHQVVVWVQQQLTELACLATAAAAAAAAEDGRSIASLSMIPSPSRHLLLAAAVASVLEMADGRKSCYCCFCYSWVAD